MAIINVEAGLRFSALCREERSETEGLGFRRRKLYSRIYGKHRRSRFSFVITREEIPAVYDKSVKDNKKLTQALSVTFSPYQSSTT